MTARDDSDALRLIHFLDRYERDHGYMPLLSEVASAVGATPKTVRHRITRLSREGLVSRRKGASRGTRLTAIGRAVAMTIQGAPGDGERECTDDVPPGVIADAGALRLLARIQTDTGA